MVLGTLILGETEESMKNKILAALAVSAASFAMADEVVNPNIWFDGTDERMCIIDPDIQENLDYYNCSYWYDLDDRKNDHGGSYIAYPYDTLGYYGSLIAPMIDSLGYLAVKYHLEDPTVTGQSEEYPYNFVKIGFGVSRGGYDPHDISLIGGLCATYTSDNRVELEINADKTGDAPCRVELPKAVEPTTVDKAIEDFAQPTWAADSNKVASCMEAFKAARSVMFKIDGGASVADGELRIFEVGPKGTCKGGKTVKDYWPGDGCKSDGDGHAQCPPCGGPGCFTKLSGLKTVSSASISVLGRLVTLNGLGQNVQYKLFDMQGNVVRSGFAAGHVDFSGVKSGSYLLKVKGSLEMTQKIVLK